MSYETITPSKLPKLLDEGAHLIDVRTPAEFKSVHVNGAELHPLDSFDAESFCQENGSDKPVYILCQSGKRASMAAHKLVAAGHRATYVVDGGTVAAIEVNVPVTRGQGAISIERQVRIAAGSLVFIGTLLGLYVHSGFFGLPAFVGAGLVFAGVTDTCGMRLILAKCPWNR
ncbi:MAG TPA: sulfurtransferase [Opitutae bacterium]|nr:sulfurtransferase [Opitutae bacterium]